MSPPRSEEHSLHRELQRLVRPLSPGLRLTNFVEPPFSIKGSPLRTTHVRATLTCVFPLRLRRLTSRPEEGEQDTSRGGGVGRVTTLRRN